MPKDKRRWADQEQVCWLAASVDEFLEAQKNQRLDKYWPKIWNAWFEKWPARKPGPGDATDSEPESDDEDDIPPDSGEEADMQSLRENSKKRKRSAKKLNAKKKKKESVSMSLVFIQPHY